MAIPLIIISQGLCFLHFAGNCKTDFVVFLFHCLPCLAVDLDMICLLSQTQRYVEILISLNQSLYVNLFTSLLSNMVLDIMMDMFNSTFVKQAYMFFFPLCGGDD